MSAVRPALDWAFLDQGGAEFVQEGDGGDEATTVTQPVAPVAVAVTSSVRPTPS